MKVELVNPKVFLDIVISNAQSGRVVIELFENIAPKASSNFIKLCSSQAEPTYKGTVFHRVIKNFIVQSGDIVHGKNVTEYPNKDLGKGNGILNGIEFEKENLGEVNEPFLVCMANENGSEYNSTQFFITLGPHPHLNGKHTVFGRVIHGKSVIREIERVDVDDENAPSKTQVVKIADCGKWEYGMEVPIFNACYDIVGGDIYEEYPDDDENIDKEKSESAFEAASIIKESGTLLFKSGNLRGALLKYKKSLRYIFEFVPDQDQDPKWFNEFVQLKKKVYLNLSLVCLKLNDYESVLKYCSFLKEMDNLSTQEKAKNHYRLGVCYNKLKKNEHALNELELASSIVPDDIAIKNELQKTGDLLKERKMREKSKYAKFFS